MVGARVRRQQVAYAQGRGLSSRRACALLSVARSTLGYVSRLIARDAPVLPAMRTRTWGRIVNISSGAARGAGAIGVHYNASKAGMEGLTRGYAARLVKEGITVNAVAPSLIETDMMRGRSDLARNIPLGRLGQPGRRAL